VTSRDDVIDGRPPYWKYFFRAARDALMEITLENKVSLISKKI
jgi:hypothetical protein